MSVESEGGKRWRRARIGAKPRASGSIFVCVRGTAALPTRRVFPRSIRTVVPRTFSTEEKEPGFSHTPPPPPLRRRRRRTRHHPLFRHTDAHSLGDDGLASSSRCCHGDAPASGSKTRHCQPMSGGGERATLRSAASERRGMRANVAAAAAAGRRFRDGLYRPTPI